MNIGVALPRGTYQTTPSGNVFYNITIPNDNPTSESIPTKKATFFEVRTTSVLTGKPSDYTLSIVRAKIPTTTIPLKIIEILPQTINPGNNINLTAYSVTLSWNGFNSHQHLIWIPQFKNASVPVSVPETAFINAPHAEYYSLTSVQYFLTLINTGLSTAAADLLTHGAPTNNPPFFYYNPTTKLISLYADSNYDSTVVGSVQIFVNNFLFNNIGQSFEFLYFGAHASNGKNNQLLVHDIEGKNHETLNGVNYFVMTQEYNTRNNMSSFASIIFASNSIPVRNELVSRQDVASSPSTSSFFRILQDLEIDAIPSDVGFDSITYNPTAEFRRMTLTSDNLDDTRTIDIQIYWKDNYDNIYPLLILPGEIATIKFLFEKIQQYTTIK